METMVLQAVSIEERQPLGAEDIGRSLGCSVSWVVELVEVGILDPLPGAGVPLFAPQALFTARRVARLQADLGVNLEGAALALDLLRRIDELEGRLARLDPGRPGPDTGGPA